MPWTRIGINPGVIKDVTRYAAAGAWVDSNLVRFRNGLPERWLGWVRYLSDTVLEGVCRSIHRWSALTGLVYTGLGTNERFYIASDDTIYDVTPIRKTSALNNAIATTNGSTRIVITDVSHGAWPGNQIVISGATTVGGLTTGQINTSHTISEYIDEDNYAVVVTGSAATSTTTGGGAFSVQYIYNAGTVDQIYGGGWGSGAWGEEEWGGTVISDQDKMGIWTQDNWGEDLVACAFDGPIFYWDATNPTNRMVNIRDLVGADGNAPTFARFIVVSHKDRHVLAFGPSNEYGSSTYAPMTVRWCSQEDIYNWNEADLAGTAGSIPLSHGSRFISAIPTQREILVFSDTTLYSLQFVGAPDIYVAEVISEGTDIAGLHAGTIFGSNAYWMGRSGFYVYDGRVQKMPCTLWTYIQANMNYQQIQKVVCSTNRAQDEIIWFYPSVAGLENDSYVSYDIANDAWTIGTLSRTAWYDADFQYSPMATDADGKMYWHETGMDDGSQEPPVPLNAYLESAPFELSSEGAFDKGDRFIFIRRILPDVLFPQSDGANTPQMRFILKMMDKPGGSVTSTDEGTVVSLTVDTFTDDLHVRLRGRSMTLRLESDTLGSLWKLGISRFDLRPDGQR